MESTEKLNVNNDDREQTALITNNKRKQDDDSNQSRQFVSKVFRSNSTFLPFGIANVLQSTTNELSKNPPIPVKTSIPSTNPWLLALHHLSQPSTSATALANASNWCAKCSIQFRLTSELVHHIRVHHATRRNYHHHHQQPTIESSTRKASINSTPSTSLTCHICYESFRERHHLTRHMTSHR